MAYGPQHGYGYGPQPPRKSSTLPIAVVGGGLAVAVVIVLALAVFRPAKKAPEPAAARTAEPVAAAPSGTSAPSTTADPMQAGDPALYSSAEPPVGADGRTVDKTSWESVYGPHSWSLTIDKGTLSCGMPEQLVFIEADGKRYALDASKACATKGRPAACGSGAVLESDSIRRTSAAGEPMSQLSLIAVGRRQCAK